jgi:hypothetical protein
LLVVESGHLVGQAAELGLQHGVRVVSDKVDQAYRCAHVGQERRPVQRVKARYRKVGGIANVVKDRCGL